MAKMMYFGTRERMTWVPCPAINYDASKMGWRESGTYLSGGAWVVGSTTAAKQYNLSWNMKRRDEVRVITDYADGLYGNGAIYFLDPFAMDRNLLPQHWASPLLGASDAPLLVGEERPTLVDTPTNINGYPFKSAVYTVMDNQYKANIFIPVPPGYVAWVGAHGTRTGSAAVRVTSILSGSASGTTTLTLLPVTGATRVNASFSGSNVNGIELSLAGSGTITLSGLTVQVLPAGTAPGTGAFISGQGNSGCSFDGMPTLSQYSAALDRVGVSIKLVETEAWL